VPAQAKPGESVAITGSRFGTQEGAVTVGPVEADKASLTWTDTRITLLVPSTARLGLAPITITRADRTQVATPITAFTVLAPDQK
jgi:hypothetical protein